MQENKGLKEEIAVMKEDRGVSTDYPSPEEFEKIKVQWSLEIAARDAKLEKMNNQLFDETKSSTSKHTACQEKADKQSAENRRLGQELGELKARNIKLEEENAEHKGQIDNLRSALDEQKLKHAILRHSIEEEGRKTTLLIANAGSQKEAYENPKADEVESELGLSQNEIQKLNGHNEPRQTHPRYPESKLRDKIANLERAGKSGTKKIEFLLQRIAELEPQGGVPLSS
jgi:hypothetical protein